MKLNLPCIQDCGKKGNTVRHCIYRVHRPMDCTLPVCQFSQYSSSQGNYHVISIHFVENKKGHIGIVEKEQETSPNTGICITIMPSLCSMNSGCILECRNTPTPQVHFDHLYLSPYLLIVTCIMGFFSSGVQQIGLWRGGQGQIYIGIKLLPVVWVCFCIPRYIHPPFMKHSDGISTQCYTFQCSGLFPVLFLQSLYVPF